MSITAVEENPSANQARRIFDMRHRPDHSATRASGFTLQREGELQEQDVWSDPQQRFIVESQADTDGKRPTTLATFQEEKRHVTAIARIVCQATMEAFIGIRPAHQLQRWLDSEVFRKVKQRADLYAGLREQDLLNSTPSTTPRPLTLERTRAEQIRNGVWEVCVLFTHEGRIRACALRLEAHRRKWKVMAFELG